MVAHFLLRGPQQPRRELEPVRSQARRDRQLRDAALAQPPFQVHLGQPEAGVQ